MTPYSPSIAIPAIDDLSTAKLLAWEKRLHSASVDYKIRQIGQKDLTKCRLKDRSSNAKRPAPIRSALSGGPWHIVQVWPYPSLTQSLAKADSGKFVRSMSMPPGKASKAFS
jgi:hypothetical protein